MRYIFETWNVNNWRRWTRWRRRQWRRRSWHSRKQRRETFVEKSYPLRSRSRSRSASRSPSPARQRQCLLCNYTRVKRNRVQHTCHSVPVLIVYRTGYHRGKKLYSVRTVLLTVKRANRTRSRHTTRNGVRLGFPSVKKGHQKEVNYSGDESRTVKRVMERMPRARRVRRWLDVLVSNGDLGTWIPSDTCVQNSKQDHNSRSGSTSELD